MSPLQKVVVAALLAAPFALMLPTHAELVADSADTTPAMKFHDAIERHDTAAIATMLHNDPKLANSNIPGESPALFQALNRSLRDIEILLLANGADVNARDDRGKTLLMAAIEQRDPMTAAMLMDKGAHVNVHDNDGATPLSIAIETSTDVDILACLFTHGVNINARDTRGFTPLRLCVGQENDLNSDSGLETAKILLRKGAQYGSPFFDAIARNDVASLAKQATVNPQLVNARFQGLAPLDQAILWQNADAAKRLLQHGADVNAKNGRGETPLVHTLDELEDDGGDNGLIKLLLENHANPNIPSQSGETPLALTASLTGADDKDMDEALGLLIAKGARVNAPSLNGLPILTNITANGVSEAAKFLLKHGASYRNALMDAIAHGDTAAVKKMLTKNPMLAKSKTAAGDPAVIVAYEWRQKAIISLLVAHGASIDAPSLMGGESALFKALSDCDADMAAFLLSKGASTSVHSSANSSSDQTPMYAAIRSAASNPKGLRLVELLIAHGVNPREVSKTGGMNALGVAVSERAASVAEMLLNKGLDVNDSGIPGYSPLSIAIRNLSPASRMLRDHGGHDLSCPLDDAIVWADLPKIKALIAANPASINQPMNAELPTPLQASLFWGNKDVVALLLDLGANPNASTNQTSPALVYLSQARMSVSPPATDDSLPKLLIARGADVNHKQPYSSPGYQTPLSAAILMGDNPLAELLLDADADVNAPDLKGDTPIFYAIGRGDKEGVALLVKHGAAINQRDALGNTPLTYAVQETSYHFWTHDEKLNLNAAVAYLRRHGAVE